MTTSRPMNPQSRLYGARSTVGFDVLRTGMTPGRARFYADPAKAEEIRQQVLADQRAALERVAAPTTGPADRVRDGAVGNQSEYPATSVAGWKKRKW